jgi:hypothetical protein
MPENFQTVSLKVFSEVTGACARSRSGPRVPVDARGRGRSRSGSLGSDATPRAVPARLSAARSSGVSRSRSATHTNTGIPSRCASSPGL